MARNGTMAAVENRLDSLRESVRHFFDIGANRMNGAASSVIATTKSGVQRAGMLVKNHPYIAIGVAFGLGFLTTRMVRR